MTRLLTTCWYLEGMLTTHTAGSATMPPIVSCSFVFRVVGFIIDDLKKNISSHYCKGIALSPSLNGLTTLRSYLSLFTSDT